MQNVKEISEASHCVDNNSQMKKGNENKVKYFSELPLVAITDPILSLAKTAKTNSANNAN